jgi:hypothetical protein
MGWFGKSKDEQETSRLLADAKRLKALSRFQSDDDVKSFIIDLLVEVCSESDLCIAAVVAEPLGQIVHTLLRSEPFLYDPDTARDPLTLKDGVNLRARLKRTTAVLIDESRLLPIWRDAVKAVLLGIVADLPVEALCDPAPDGTVPSAPALCAYKPLGEMVGDLPHLLTCFFGTFCAADLSDAGLFYDLSLMLDNRLCIASGVAWEDRFKSIKKMRLPIDRAELPVSELASLYTEATPFEGFFDLPIPLHIPDDVRFEHTHIVGGTGHGKTQLLQYLLMRDLDRALDTTMSLVVIDPDGTLIKTISGTDYFDDLLLADRCIFIDPSEVERPVSLNLFDVSQLEGADARTRETIENNTIELFEYFFDALLGSELTGKQSTLFRYLGLLLMQIPSGNIHTLRSILEDVRPFKGYIDTLPDTARAFFETRFGSRDLQATKTQVLSRLWGVLSNRSLDRVLSGTRNSINFDDALQSGKIIFVHTSKENLGEEGSAIFARMIVALLGQSLIRRAAIPANQRTDTYIYIDEAEGVVDQTLVRLLAQVRKYRGAITIAHQHLDQLSASARAGVFANTSIKLAGGISAKDAAALAPEMRTKADHLLSFRKDSDISRFALFAKNYTQTAMTLEVPLGYAEGFDRLEAEEYAALLEQSREQYGRRIAETLQAIEPTAGLAPDISFEDLTPATTVDEAAVELRASPQHIESVTQPTYRKEGGGGVRHRAIQNTIKELGEAAAYRVTLEEVILDGEGRVDAILRKNDELICCEVSVTTSREHELHNVKKCLRFGASKVLLVTNLARHRTGLADYMQVHLSAEEYSKLSVVLADELAAYVVGDDHPNEAVEKIVKGYRVSSKVTGMAVRKSLSTMFGDVG